MTRSERLKTYAIIALVVFALSIVVFVFLLTSVIKKNNEARGFSVEIQSETVKEAKLKSIKLTVANNEPRENLANYFIPPEGAVGFIELIESLSQYGAGVSIESVNVEPYSNNNFEWLVVDVSASGGWNDVVGTLSLMESLPVRMEAEEVSISYGGSSDLWDLRMKIRALKEI